jgi:hypothetical protein
VHIVRFAPKMLNTAHKEHLIERVPVRIYEPAKTVADLFFSAHRQHRWYGSKVGLTQAVQGMKEALRQRKATPAEIARYAEQVGYVLERLLYRLSQSKHCDRFALKGAILMTAGLDDPHRPTRDLDLLGFGDPDPDAMIAIFREVCAIKADDAAVFDIEGLTVDRIRDEQEYGGLRLRTTATVDGARVRVVIDIGFGDVVVPRVEEMELSVLLDQPAPRLRTYPRESVIAEKFHAMVVLGRANSRMKDFHDIWVLKRTFEFKGDALARAIAATFGRRKTEIPAERPERSAAPLPKIRPSGSDGRRFCRMSLSSRPARSPTSSTRSRIF